jgi:hypothetical protein
VDAFRSFFETEVAGRGTLAIFGGGKQPAWLPFRDSNRDMQFLEWQIYLVRKIAVVLGLTPQDLGVTFDINRSTAETQIQISEDRGLRPMMSLAQEYFTEEVVWDAAFGGQDNNLAFRYTALNLKESTAKANINKIALANVPWRYVNEARIAEGREPIPELEGKLIMATSVGAVDLSDVPTVREVLEMQTKKNEPAPAPSEKALLLEGPQVHVAAPDLSPLERLAAAFDRPTEKTEAPVVNVISGSLPPRPDPVIVTRDVYFERDEKDQPTAKIEVRTYDNGNVRRVRTEYTYEDGIITGKREAEVVNQ